VRWASVLPDPHDTSGSARKPFEKKAGIYFLSRERYDTEILITEPKEEGESQAPTYLLEYFELVRFMKNIIQLRPEDTRRILDHLWNFYRVAFDSTTGRSVVLRTVDLEGWESEIQLLFKEFT
jgi:hypothetical protein